MADKPRLINGQWVKPPAGGWAKPPKLPPGVVPWMGKARPSAQAALDRQILNALRDVAGSPAKGPRKPKG